MKKVSLVVTFILFFFFTMQAQNKDSVWTTGGNVGLFFQQVGLKNWAGGGENSLAYGLEFNFFHNKATESSTWDNVLQAGYGIVKQGDTETRKNNDVLIITSKYGRFLSEFWQFSAGTDFRTQFANGYIYGGATDGSDTLISTFMAPGYLTPYIGLTYKPNNSFSATIAPLTAKFTFVMDDQLSALGAYGVSPGEKMRSQIGLSLNALYQKQIMENVSLKSNLLLFMDYADANHIDINFDLFLAMKINKWLSTNFSVQTIYDHDIKIEDKEGKVGPRLQLRNVLNVGIALKFGEELPK